MWAQSLRSDSIQFHSSRRSVILIRFVYWLLVACDCQWCIEFLIACPFTCFFPEFLEMCLKWIKLIIFEIDWFRKEWKVICLCRRIVVVTLGVVFFMIDVTNQCTARWTNCLRAWHKQEALPQLTKFKKMMVNNQILAFLALNTYVEMSTIIALLMHGVPTAVAFEFLICKHELFSGFPLKTFKLFVECLTGYLCCLVSAALTYRYNDCCLLT